MRKPIPNYLKAQLKFRYSTAKCILHDIHVGSEDLVLVVGDPDNGCYEYVIYEGGGRKITSSDCGYGDSTIALRDGLIVYHGLPDRLPVGLEKEAA